MKTELTGQIAFASGKVGDYDIWTFDLSTGELNQITTGTGWNDKPAWSPDGKWIAFISDRSGFQEIYKVSAEGGDPVQLTHANGWCDAPRFSPDGSQIAYMSNESGNNDIWVMDADGQNQQQITSHSGSDSHVEWTPDGQSLVWSSNRDGQYQNIWRWNLATGQTTQLTNEPAEDIEPVPSPCGNYIVFVSNRQQNPEQAKSHFSDRDKDLWIMTSEGKHPVRITDNQGCDFCACWSPDGHYLMYASAHDKSDCHLRIIDVSEIIEAFATGNEQAIEKAADSVRSEHIPIERESLQEEIGAMRYTTFVTRLMPQSWVQPFYPPGYFGQERWPHWIAAQPSPTTTDKSAVEQAQIS